MVCKYRIHFNPCSWHIISFKWHNLIKLGVTLIKVQTADDIYPLLPHCVGVFFESEAWIWWNWINKMPLYWLFSICRGVNLLKYFWKTIFYLKWPFSKIKSRSYREAVMVLFTKQLHFIIYSIHFSFNQNDRNDHKKWPNLSNLDTKCPVFQKHLFYREPSVNEWDW